MTNPKMSDAAAIALHDRATRGEKLTAEERTALDTWYALQDADELAAQAFAPSSSGLESVQTQVNDALARLRILTQQIELQAAENERLRRENAALRQAFSETQAPQRA